VLRQRSQFCDSSGSFFGVRPDGEANFTGVHDIADYVRRKNHGRENTTELEQQVSNHVRALKEHDQRMVRLNRQLATERPVAIV
jgi:hypothetical protein